MIKITINIIIIIVITDILLFMVYIRVPCHFLEFAGNGVGNAAEDYYGLISPPYDNCLESDH